VKWNDHLVNIPGLQEAMWHPSVIHTFSSLTIIYCIHLRDDMKGLLGGTKSNAKSHAFSLGEISIFAWYQFIECPRRTDSTSVNSW
jgi:hypothetical protein